MQAPVPMLTGAAGKNSVALVLSLLVGLAVVAAVKQHKPATPTTYRT